MQPSCTDCYLWSQPSLLKGTGEEAAPAAPSASAPASASEAAVYDVRVDGKLYSVEVGAQGELGAITPAPAAPAQAAPAAAPAPSGQTINAPLAGNVFKILVSPGDQVANGDVVIILEAMKMETEIRSAFDGTVSSIQVKDGDSVSSGQPLISLG